MIISTLVFLFLVFLFLVFLFGSYWVLPSRLSLLFVNLQNFSQSLFNFNSLTISYIFLSLFYFLMFLNVFSNLPMSSSPSLYYFFSASLSFILWVSILSVILNTQLNSFISHIIPYGAPIFLSLLLPLIEIFSQVIRPLTLIIRLSTNLSAGHIILYIFSFFSLSSLPIASLIFWLSIALYLLELSISLLQAYIFTSLSFMYLSESL